MRKKALIIGGGLGGLSAALTLSTEYDVQIIEKNAQLGGKMRAINLDGFHFDFGPNTLTMPHYFWDVIAPFGEPEKRLPFKKIALPTHHQLDDFELVFTTDQQAMIEQLAKIDHKSAQNYPAFIREITSLYKRSEKPFLQKTFFSFADYCDPSLPASIIQMHPFTTLSAFLEKYFPHPFVRQLFERFATYIGSSPFEAPATFALIAYFELVEGTYSLEGGASKIAAVFEELLIAQHVVIHTDELVTSLNHLNNKITGCTTTKGHYEADLVICNADYDVFQQLLGRKTTKKQRSTSAYVELIGLKSPVPLHHHNVLFSADYKKEFQALHTGHYAENPTVYSCYPYASDSSNPPALFVLINAPSNAPLAVEKLTLQVDTALLKWGISKQHIVTRQVLPPSFIAEEFLTAGGAIYGQASNSLKNSFFRPRNRDSQFNNLYYVGGSVHPGGGSPIVVKSGYEMAKRILKNNEATLTN
ncbi:phytoene desaturase family protein [Kurthia sibirica]|uniref:4,4'-diaponeurosporene oxygenase n=1 Tax=Kurthia sibirica TaxID=202750 RepID=A0A2U3ANN9_9BACL|nr:phytoene desaturase family protein [Kurthia sibirica]PWI26119.1 phytoene desaturase [Kurthia sibirica]GEK33375.1 phytoene desaturase [Kurthia sibirica]